MVNRTVEIEKYWAAVVGKTGEFKQIAAAENPEFNNLASCIKRILQDSFIQDATEYGVERWEKMLGLSYQKVYQGPIQYTKVGSPTIKDGVASGFSADNYLQLNAYPDLDKDFESQVTFSLNSFLAGGLFCEKDWDYNGWHFISPGNTLAFSLNMKNGSSTYYPRISFYGLQKDVTYKARAVRNGRDITAYLYEGDTLKETQTITINEGYSVVKNSDITYLIGRNISNYINANVDLNDTYLKIGGELWFGKEQNTDTLEDRKIKILTYLSLRLPYTWRVLEQMIASFVGEGNYTMSYVNDYAKLTIRIKAENESSYNTIMGLLKNVVPQNIIIDLGRL